MLDFETLSRFRCVNGACKRIVDALPQYKDIMTHAQGALRHTLRQIRSVGIYSKIGARELHQVFIGHKCDNCDSFGYFLYLPTFTRVCARCIQRSEQFDTISVLKARKLYGIDDKDIQSLHAINIYGSIYPSQKPQYNEYVNRLAAKKLGLSKYGGETEMVTFAKKQNRHAYRALKTSSDGKPYEIISWEKTYITMGYLNLSSGHVEHGTCCRACQQKDKSSGVHDRHMCSDRYFALLDKVFTNKGFLLHFSTCTHVKDLLEPKGLVLG